MILWNYDYTHLHHCALTEEFCMHFQKNYACEGIISALQGQEVFQFAKAIQ